MTHKKTLNNRQKADVLAIIREYGTIKSAEEVVGATALHNERKASVIFNKHCLEAIREGKNKLGDESVELLRQCATGKVPMNKSQLTANIALANAYAEGFRGTTRTEGKIEHEVRIITAVPRPKYIEVETNDKPQITEGEVKEVDKQEINNG